MDIKVVESVLVCGIKVRTSLKGIMEFVGSTPDRLMAELASQGIKPERMQSVGYGESRPVDTNQTEEGRAQNRRVEFTLIKK